MKTKQKKFKFSKGEISEKLLERQDLNILESSASYIKNYISTPFGAIKTRQGTKEIDEVINTLTELSTPTIDNSIGGTDANLWNTTALFISGGIGANTEYFKYDFGSDMQIDRIMVEDICFNYSEAILAAIIEDGVITSVDIDSGGAGLNNVVLTVTDIGRTGSGAILTAVTNDSGVITGVTVVDGGTNYSSRTVITVTADKPSATLTIAGSGDDAAYTTISTATITDTAQDLDISLDATYRYIKFTGEAQDAVLNLYYAKAYTETKTLTKLIPFVFNLNQKYLLVVSDEQIKIYEDDINTVTLTATDLLESYLTRLKYSQAEDTMVFTHPDLRTKQLQRRADYTDTFTADAGTDVITASEANLYNGAKVQLTTTNTLPAGLSLATDYYVIEASGNTCKLSLTLGGSAVDITDAGTGTHTLNFQGLFWQFEDFPFTNMPSVLYGQEVTTNPAVTLTPSATEGSVKLTTSGATFSAGSVGQIIDGGGGRVRITEYESPTAVYGYTIIPFYTTSSIGSGKWDYITGYEAIWSTNRGWPTTCLFYQQRLWLGGSKSKPNTIAGSRVGQYNSFENIGNYNNDAILATISSEQIDEIVNIYANRGIQVFTAGAEWIVPESATTPDTFAITKNTSNGSLNTVPPTDIAGTTLFIEKNGKSMLSFIYSDEQAAYSTASVSVYTDILNMPVSLAVDYNSSQDIGNFLYVVMGSGYMGVWCIDLAQNIMSPVRFITDGNYKEVANVAGDTYFIVDRKGKLYLEKVGDYKTDLTVTDSSLSENITGLDIFNGYNVRAYTDTTNYGTYHCYNGEITLSDTPTETVYIGLDLPCELISNKTQVNAQTSNIDKRIAKATVTTRNTDSLTFCNQALSQSDDIYDYYGVTSWDRDCRYTINSTFTPVEILSIMLNINYGVK